MLVQPLACRQSTVPLPHGAKPTSHQQPPSPCRSSGSASPPAARRSPQLQPRSSRRAAKPEQQRPSASSHLGRLPPRGGLGPGWPSCSPWPLQSASGPCTCELLLVGQCDALLHGCQLPLPWWRRPRCRSVHRPWHRRRPPTSPGHPPLLAGCMRKIGGPRQWASGSTSA